jgi:hypothetical protein
MQPAFPVRQQTDDLAWEASRPIIAHVTGRWQRGSRESAILATLSRLAPVFVLEPPVFTQDVAIGRIDVTLPMPQVWRAIPQLPAELAQDEEEALDRIRHFAQQLVGASAPLSPRFPGPLHWFFTPLPAPHMLRAFGEVGVVYDCLDDRTWLRSTLAGAVERERLLLRSADVIFASRSAAIRIRSRGREPVVLDRGIRTAEEWADAAREMDLVVRERLTSGRDGVHEREAPRVAPERMDGLLRNPIPASRPQRYR